MAWPLNILSRPQIHPGAGEERTKLWVIKPESKETEDDLASSTSSSDQDSIEDDSSLFNDDNELEEHRDNRQHENSSIMVLSERSREQGKAMKRLKTLPSADPLETHTKRSILSEKVTTKDYNWSKACHLLANDDSKVWVLDTQGLHSPRYMDGAVDNEESNLAIVWQIVYVQTIAGLKFHKVLYYLSVDA